MSVWSQWGPVVPWIVTSVSVAYVTYLHFKLRRQRDRQEEDRLLMNPDRHDRKHVFKVGEHLLKGKKLSLCRCWRSETFPFCDGAHKQYNKESGECVGAVVVKWEDEDFDNQTKTLVEQMDIQSMNASTELSSLEMIDSNGENGSSRGSPHSPQSTGDDNNIFDN